MKIKIRRVLIALCAALAISSLSVVMMVISAQEGRQIQTARVEGFIVAPAKREFSETLMRGLRVPDGFRVSVFARPRGNARMIWTGEDGTIYLTRQEEGDVMMLPIDHCFVSQGVKVLNIRTGNEFVSDHLPLIVELELG